MIVFTPAPVEKFTFAWNVAATQGTLPEAAIPVPEIATLRPVSQLPPIVSPVSLCVPAAGFKIFTAGAVVSRIKDLESWPIWFCALV
ncbi:hypothetical protein D3C72_1764900 [compost metagenome]